MRHTSLLYSTVFALLATTTSMSLAEQQPLLLYPAGHPANEGQDPPQTPGDWGATVTRRPGILPFLPAKPAASRAAVVICPGGGYGRLAMQHEGTEVAKWFADHGIAAFVCKYRCGGGKNMYPVPQQDAQRALRLVRSRADEWNIDPHKVGIMGFSAGGHLAASVTTLGEAEGLDPTDPIDQQSSVPDFGIYIYGVMSMLPGGSHGGSRMNLIGGDASADLARRLTPPLQVNEQSPPMFILHAADDGAVPVANALDLARACVEHKVPVELHIIPTGGHGFGIRGDASDCTRQWPTWLESWLVDRQLLTAP